MFTSTVQGATLHVDPFALNGLIVGGAANCSRCPRSSPTSQRARHHRRTARENHIYGGRSGVSPARAIPAIVMNDDQSVSCPLRGSSPAVSDSCRIRALMAW